MDVVLQDINELVNIVNTVNLRTDRLAKSSMTIAKSANHINDISNNINHNRPITKYKYNKYLSKAKLFLSLNSHN